MHSEFVKSYSTTIVLNFVGSVKSTPKRYANASII